MKTRARTLTALLVLGSAALMALHVGCDSGDPQGSDFWIDPGSHQFSEGQTSVSLSVNGGESPFTWSVTDSSLGALTGVKAGEETSSRVANYAPASGKVGANTVTVTDGKGWLASARMVVGEDPGANPLRIEPTTKVLSAGETSFPLRAIGGGPQFTWSVSDTDVGSLQGVPGSATEARVATYLVNASAPTGVVNTVIVTSNGEAATCTVVPAN